MRIPATTWTRLLRADACIDRAPPRRRAPLRIKRPSRRVPGTAGAARQGARRLRWLLWRRCPRCARPRPTSSSARWCSRRRLPTKPSRRRGRRHSRCSPSPSRRPTSSSPKRRKPRAASRRRSAPSSSRRSRVSCRRAHASSVDVDALERFGAESIASGCADVIEAEASSSSARPRRGLAAPQHHAPVDLPRPPSRRIVVVDASQGGAGRAAAPAPPSAIAASTSRARTSRACRRTPSLEGPGVGPRARRRLGARAEAGGVAEAPDDHPDLGDITTKPHALSLTGDVLRVAARSRARRLPAGGRARSDAGEDRLLPVATSPGAADDDEESSSSPVS